MASEKVEFEINIGGNAMSGVVNLNGKVDDLLGTAKKSEGVFDRLGKSALYLDSIMSIAGKVFGRIPDLINEGTDAYNEQVAAQTKLATIMRQRMSATEADIDSIKKLAEAQMKLGVIDDDTQISGAQQLGTFVNQTGALKTLIPAMNNLLAQQKGCNATSEDAVGIGNLMGKAMQGQVEALKRVGITFSDAEANVMNYGNEQERAAMLARIITNNVGNMNAALANTDAGKAAQMANRMGDAKKRMGAMVVHIKGLAFPFISSLMTRLGAIFDKLEANWPQIESAAVTAIGIIGGAINGLISVLSVVWTVLSSTVGLIVNYFPIFAGVAAAIIAINVALSWQDIILDILIAKEALIATATKVWTGVQAALNVVMSANPLGLVIAAIAILIGVVVVCWKKFAGFRAVIKTVWDTVKGFGGILKDFVIDRVKGIIEGLGAIGSALLKLFHGDFKGAWNSAKEGVVKISGVEAAQKAISAVRKSVNGIGDDYQKHLTAEQQAQAKKDGKKNADSARVAMPKMPTMPGTNAALMQAANGTGKAKAPKAAKSSAEATVTGGTRNTAITINFSREMVKMDFSGGLLDNREQVTQTMAEAMERVLLAAKAAI